jgi:hypothetical protein
LLKLLSIHNQFLGDIFMKKHKTTLLLILQLSFATFFFGTLFLKLGTPLNPAISSSFENISLNSSSWSNATVISDDVTGWNNQTSDSPAVAVDAAGVVHVVWHDWTKGIWYQGSSDCEIMYANYSSSSGWSHPIVISDGYQGIWWNDGQSYDPAIAVDSTGAVHVVWWDYTVGPWSDPPNDEEIMYAKYTPGSGWSNATVISDGYQGVWWNSNYSRYPAITVGPDDTLHVVWQDRTPGWWGPATDDYEIMYINNTGAGWSNVTVISDNQTQWNDADSRYPAIAVSNSGNIHVVWEDETSGAWGGGPTDFEIMYANFMGSSWSQPVVISDGYGGIYWNDDRSYSPDITITPSGKIHVVWHDITDGEWGIDSEIMHVVYDTLWSNVTIISDDATLWNNGSSNFAAIVADSTGDVHVVWEDDTKGDWTAPLYKGFADDAEIMYRKFAEKTGWSSISIISDGYNGLWWNNETSREPAIALDGSTLHVVWWDDTNSYWGTDTEIMHVGIKLPSGGSIFPLILLILFPLIGLGLAIFILYQRRERL